MSLAKFFELTESLYSTQQSQTYPELQWSEIEPLLINLQVTLNQQIPEKSQIRFIEFLLKYIELALSYLSSFKITQYALQMKYFSKLLYFLPEALNAQKLCNLFVTTSTMGVLNLLIYMNFSTFAKRHLLFVFNRNLEKCDQETKEATGTENVSYIYKLFDLLTTYGDYSLQCDIMETVFRLYPHLIKNKDLKYSILPEMPELSAALLTEISSNTFDSDIRAWLSKLNKNSTHIFSIKATKVTLGNVLCTPHQADIIWLDFNLKDQVFSFSTATSVNNCEWNLLYFPVQYVKSVEVCKSQSFVEIEKTTVVSVILTNPCISTNNQHYWNTVGKTLEIVISEEKDAPTSWLISHVLPKMFGKVFHHRSSIRRSITLKEKKVYRPLRKRQLSKSRSSQASRSKSRSSTHNSDYVSGISMECLGSAEKSPSGGQTSVSSKISDQISTQMVVADKNLTKNEPTDRQEKLSYGPTASICSNSSLDMTFSRTDSNAVTSRPVTPALESASDASSEADACKSFLLKLDPLLDIHSIKVSPVATKPAEMSTVHKCAPAEIEQSQDQKEASCKMLKDMTKITVINSPTTEEPKTILEQPELKVIANYNDTNATNSAADIRKRLINFLEDNKKAEEESLAEKRLSKKRKKDKPAEKESKPKTPPPRILSKKRKKDKPAEKESKPKTPPPRRLFNENNLDYMDTLNWSTPDYESGSHQDNHHQKTKMVKPKTRKLKNITTSKKNKNQRKRKPKRMKLKSSMQELTCDVSHIKKTEDIFPVSKNPRTPTFFQNDPFWDAVARDLSDIPAGKSTSIQASSDSCSPFFTDGSTASPQKLPELEIEPIGFNFDKQRKSPKIRVLQNIVIAQPRQSPPAAELCHEPPPKKLKLDQDDEFSPVNVPSEHPDNNLMRDAWKAMHRITTWIVQGTKTNAQKVIEFIQSLPHEEGVSDV